MQQWTKEKINILYTTVLFFRNIKKVVQQAACIYRTIVKVYNIAIYIKLFIKYLKAKKAYCLSLVYSKWFNRLLINSYLSFSEKSRF